MYKQSNMKSSLRLKPKTPLEKEQNHKITTILTHLGNHQDSLDFREPVDWQAMELYDYPQIIKNPMDLRTVTQRFKDKKYKTVEAVLNDIQIIWDNCKLYNSKNSDIYKLADRLELNFRKMIKNYLPQMKVATVTSSPSRPVIDPPFEVIYMPDRGNVKINVEHKKAFLSKLEILQENQFEKILNQVQKLTPKCFKEISEDWAKIDLSEMDNSQFMVLNNFLDETIKQTNTRTRVTRSSTGLV